MASRSRMESNRWLRLQTESIRGRVLSIGSEDDSDGEGRRYRDYFTNCSSYTTSEVSAGFGTDLVLDVRHMPEIPNNAYDCIFCSGVIEHVDDHPAAMRELTRILKPGGTLLFGVPFRQAIHLAPHDYWRFTEHGLRMLLSQFGYVCEELVEVDSSPAESFPAAYWARAGKPVSDEKSSGNGVAYNLVNKFFDQRDVDADQASVAELRRFDPDLAALMDQKEIKDLRKWEYSALLNAFGHSFHGKKVLDVGCGRSLFSTYLAKLGAEVITFDLPTPLQQQDAAMEKRTAAGVTHVQGNMLNMPFDSGCFDLVISISAIEHFQEVPGDPSHPRPKGDFLADTERAVREMARVTKKGGHLFLTSDVYDPELQKDDQWRKGRGVTCAYAPDEFRTAILKPLLEAGMSFDRPFDYEFDSVIADEARSTCRGRYFSTFVLLLQQAADPAASTDLPAPLPTEDRGSVSGGPRVHIVIADEGWVLEQMAREIGRRLSYVSVGREPDPTAAINYYVNYSAFRGRVGGVEVALFTHLEERAPAAARRFLEVAASVDVCICMSDIYAKRLTEAGIQNVVAITPGVDLNLFKPSIRVGIVGRTYPTGRKGEDLLRQVMNEQGIEWHFTGSGWPGPARQYAPEDMPAFYNSVDYVLVPAYYEGGPMCVLEALACGKEVIAPPVGFVPDYPHIEFATGDAEDLRRVLRQLVAKRQLLRESVLHRSWDAWADHHDHLFRQLMEQPKVVEPVEHKQVRVLLATHSMERTAGGGPTIRLEETRRALERLGLHVDVAHDDQPDASGYDLVHVFNVWPPDQALSKLRHLKKFDIPIVFSPIYMDLSETAWAYSAVPHVFANAQSPEELRRYLTAIAEGNVTVDGASRDARREIVHSYFSMLKEMVDLSDHLVALGHLEMRKLWETGIKPRPYTLVHNAADANRFSDATGDTFSERYGVKDYVLCVGRIEQRKNQLLLAQALKGTGIPLVLIGHAPDPDYLRLVERHADPNIVFVERLPHESDLLASAYAGARVFALPSWVEGAPLTALEAACAGTALVLSDRASEREYFGELALYCDPADVASIRDAVLRAYNDVAHDARVRQDLKTLMQTKYTWENAAKETVDAYVQALKDFISREGTGSEDGTGQSAPSAPGHSEPPIAAGQGKVRKLEIGSGNNPQPGYEHMDVRPDLPHLEHVHDFNQPLPFPDGTFDEILSHSSLEHVSWRRITGILRDWMRVLKPGGAVKVWMPDLEYLCRTYLSGKTDQHLDPAYIPTIEAALGSYTPATWAAVKMFGGQDYPDNFHAALYDLNSFSEVLRSAGFERVQRLAPYHGLNILACKPLVIPGDGAKPETEAKDTSRSRAKPSEKQEVSLPAKGEGSPLPVSAKALAIKWGAYIFDYSGYARLNRDTIIALDRSGVDVTAESFSLDESFKTNLVNDPGLLATWQRLQNGHSTGGVCVCCHPPTTWDGANIFNRFKLRNSDMGAFVGITMFETDRLPAAWATACNSMDEVWVPSSFNKRTFARSGVNADKIRVIPFGIDAAAYAPARVEPLPIAGKKGFTFLSTFQWNKRKGWDVLLEAYLSAFSDKDDVCLVLRTYPDRIKTPPIRERINAFAHQLGRNPKTTPAIILIEDFIPEERMPSLYAAADAFVLPTRGEGWGIPFMEAMASGLPTIGTRWSSHLDFMDDDNSYLIEIAGLVPVDSDQTADNPFYTSDQLWAQPSVEHTAALMRRVYEHREEAERRGRKARQDISEKWTLERTAAWIAEQGAALLAKDASKAAEPSTKAESAPDVVWQAPIYDPSGYADEARQLILNLKPQGIKVAARAIGRHSDTFRRQLDRPTQQSLDTALARKVSPGFINVVHFPAYAFRRVPEARYQIGRVMFETDGLPSDWVEKCNQMDEIWVPTDFNLQTFKSAGVRAPLFKVPGGVDAEQFNPNARPLPITGARGKVFLSVFEWIYRKGWDVLLRAWAQAFSADDDVTLVLRTYPPNATDIPDVQMEIEGRIDRFLREEMGIVRSQIAPIVVLGEQIPERDLPRLFASAAAYVAPSRGEGWGRPHMQAMACGLPVIATRWSGNLEFMTDENSLLVDVEKLVEIDERAEFPFYRGQHWAEPSAKHLSTLLRKVVEQPEEMKRLGERARRDIVEKWQWKRITEIAAARLREIQAHLVSDECPPSTLAVRWEGSQFVHHSLALVNREICLQLADAKQELSIIPYEPDQFGPSADPRFPKIASRVHAPLSRPADVHVRHQWPPRFDAPSEGHWVMMQPWEFGAVPRDWIETMATQVDEVWAYTSFVRDSYIASGMPADRVQIVPAGVNCALFRPDTAPMPIGTDKRYKFLFVGGTISRKGIDVLLDAFVQSFTASDDVCLVVKDMGGKSFYQGQTAEEMIRQIQALPNAPEIVYLNDDLAPSRLPALYTACDCLVHPYRGEGFGLPIAEAMACGLPVVVTGAGAAMDFCDDEVAYLIPAIRTNLQENRIGQWETAGTPFWYEPVRAEAARLMRHVYDHQDEARAKGVAASKRITEQFTWKHAAARAMERIQLLRQRPILRHQKPAVTPLKTVLFAATGLPCLPETLVAGTELPLAIQVAATPTAAAPGLDKLKKGLSGGWSIEPSDRCTVELLNQALQSGGKDPVLLLASDLAVAQGWQAPLLSALESDPTTAVAGPVSNLAPQHQKVPAKYSGTGKEFRHFVARRAKSNDGKVGQAPYLGGFCLAFKPDLCRQTGLLREDLSLHQALWDYFGRLQAAGYRLAVAKGSFVHHERLSAEEGAGYDELAAAQEQVSRMMALGQRAVEAGDLETAASEFEKVAQKYPELAAAHTALGSTLVALGRTKDALPSLRRAVALIPNSAALRNQLGVALYQMGEPVEAEAAFREAKTAEPTDTQAHLNLINLYRAQDRYTEATEEVKQAMQIDPDNANVLVSLATLALELGDREAAEMAICRIDGMQPKHPTLPQLRKAMQGAHVTI